MAAPIKNLDTGHEDSIHDAQMDYYGKRLATASSDATVRIFDVEGSNHTLVQELKGHDGPVWEVAWAHPSFGNIVASCSYDWRVILWKESANGEWINLHEHTVHSFSVNSIAFAPHEYGLHLACASSDGTVTVLSNEGGRTWTTKKIDPAHQIGVNTVSWAPTNIINLKGSNGNQHEYGPMTLVTGGCDNVVKVWVYKEESWILTHTLTHHKDWVRDAAWAPNVGLPGALLATCGQDKQVYIIRFDQKTGEPSVAKQLQAAPFGDVVWRVSWSVTGNILAVSGGDYKVTLWKEAIDGSWECISDESL